MTTSRPDSRCRGHWALAATALLSVLPVGCAPSPASQAARRELLWDAARECKGRFGTIRSVDQIDDRGRISFTYVGSGPENEAFRDCVLQLVQEKSQARPPVALGRVVPRTPDLRKTTLPLEVRGQALVVRTSVNEVEPANLVLDTGSAYTILRPPLLRRVGVDIPANASRWPLTIVGGKQVDIPFVRLRSLRLGELAVEDLDVGAFEVLPAATGVDGLLGANVFQHFRVTVDRDARTLSLEMK
jgi:hypothetical protein